MTGDFMRGTALITGGAKRLGREIALMLGEMGFKIALHYNKSQELAENLICELNNRDVVCELFQGNLKDESSLSGLIPRVVKRFDDLSLLVNNASVFERAGLRETSFNLFENNFLVNFKAAYFLSRDFANFCNSGHIINMLDAKVAQNDISYSAYTLSKMALANFTIMAAKELAPHFRVNGISPGYILPPEKEAKDYLQKRPEKIPIQRKGEPYEITKSIAFLVENAFITGLNLYVDGGEHL